MLLDKEALTLYLVTDRFGQKIPAFLKILETACQSGITILQLREKQASTREFYQLGLAVKAITDRYQIPLIINDRLDICLALEADGLHIGDDELPVDVARRLLGPDKILGVSAKTVARGLAAQSQGADYLGVGAMYPTTTKVVTKPTSFDTLKEITGSVTIPTVAIGGITAANVANFADTGVAGICMVSEIMKATDVAAKVRAIRLAESQSGIGGAYYE